MKVTVLSAVLSLTSYNAGAFVGYSGSLSIHTQHPGLLHQRKQRQHESRLSSSLSQAPAAASRIGQRRQPPRVPRVVSMSAAGGENAAEAGDKEEEERSAMPPAEIDTSSSSAKSGAMPDAEPQERLEGEC